MIDLTIIRDGIGGTQRRVTFTASAPGYVDATDGVDVSPNSMKHRCKVYHSTTQNILNTIATVLTWDSEEYDPQGMHSAGTNPSRITVPAVGLPSAVILTTQVSWQVNSVGTRRVHILKNGSPIGKSLLGASNSGLIQMVLVPDDSPAGGDYYQVEVTEVSGSNLDVIGSISESWFSLTHAQAS